MEIEKKQSEKLIKFREIFKQNQISAYIVPHNDAHDSEYIAETDERLAFVSGFTGSAGFGLVTMEEAHLWTDSRYFIQADKQLEQGWQLQKIVRDYTPWYRFLYEKYGEGYTVGYDALLMNSKTIDDVNSLFEKKNMILKPISSNLADQLWENKPNETIQEIFIHDQKWHNYPFGEKYQQIKEIVLGQGASVYITAKLDEIAWALNLRGSDISYNPVFKSYLVLNFSENQNGRGVLYIDEKKVNEQVKLYLAGMHIEIKSYDQIFQDLMQLTKLCKIGLQTSEINRKLFESINQNNIINLASPTPICILKSKKNKTEIEGFKQSHIRDGSALVSYLAWLEDQLIVQKNTQLTEYTAALELEKKRRALDYNVGLSFDTISSIGANGAIVHYKAEEKTAATLNAGEMYLLDSGGQYFDGTTDVTRTVHYTTPTNEQKDAYTRVLLGNLDLKMAIWPKKNNIAGSDLDVLARRHLWKKKLDYGHGTGHGVGYFLNVHEGPQGISKLRRQVLEEGMLVTDEPGYYKEGEYGIRIEDVLAVVDVGDDHLGFYNFTQCPYDQNLIDRSLLTKEYTDYINEYHKQVYANLAPILEKQNDSLALKWLTKHTQPITL